MCVRISEGCASHTYYLINTNLYIKIVEYSTTLLKYCDNRNILHYTIGIDSKYL